MALYYGPVANLMAVGTVFLIRITFVWAQHIRCACMQDMHA